MYLFLLTVVYCLVTRVLNISFELSLGIYLIGLGLVKGFFTDELKDVFNLKRAKYLYEERGFKNSTMELLSLILIFINSYLIDYEPFSLFEFVYMFFLIAFVYRFIFWGIIQAIWERKK
ncbi:hypothetical protein ABH966_005096 [Lysinibacillus sp. RC46]|uniref:hypothetical protein n=1 Tax=unclassified Lysinibacillus TaxID=2636778 RepID=UPI0035148908